MRIQDMFYKGPSLQKLHTDYAQAGKTDARAPLWNSASIIIDAPIASVWKIICDLPNRHLWHPGFELLAMDKFEPEQKFSWKLNGMRLKSQIAIIIPEKELTWSGIFLAYKAVDRQLLESLPDNKTKVTIEESLAGTLLPLFFNRKQLQTGHEKMLTGLKRFAESAIPQIGE